MKNLVVILALAIAVTGCNSKPQAHLTLCELMANKDAYNGQVISISGYYYYGMLWQEDCKEGIAVNEGKSVKKDEIYLKFLELDKDSETIERLSSPDKPYGITYKVIFKGKYWRKADIGETGYLELHQMEQVEATDIDALKMEPWLTKDNSASSEVYASAGTEPKLTDAD